MSFLLDKTYRRPKLITFAIPSVESNLHIGEPEVVKLNKLLPKARKILQEHGVLGGTFVVECTTRLIWSDLAIEDQMWKHHAHVHMVALAPFMQRSELIEFSKSLLPLGLGRINYVAPSGHWKDAKAKVAAYISKYLVKEKRSSRTWGIMRSTKNYHSTMNSHQAVAVPNNATTNPTTSINGRGPSETAKAAPKVHARAVALNARESLTKSSASSESEPSDVDQINILTGSHLSGPSA